MYLAGKPSETTAILASRIQQLNKVLLDGFDLQDAPIQLESINNLYESFDRTQLFLVTDGMIHMTHEGHPMVGFEEGDLIGLLNAFDLPCPVYKSEEFVELTPINRDEFLKYIYTDKRRQHYWSHLLLTLHALSVHQASQLTQHHVRPTAGFQNYQPGEVIIQQGDEAEHVYTIITGHADVHANGIKVGEIGEEEVFGAMAVFTKEKRSATVTAITPCTVMAVPKNEFTTLIEAQPQAAVTLIENLARRISALNQQLVESKSEELSEA